MNKGERGARAGRLWLEQEEQRKSDEKHFADKLIEELEAGIFTIRELAEFAAHKAIAVDVSVGKSINSFRTRLAVSSGGVKALNKLHNPDKDIAEIYTRNSKLGEGKRGKTIAIKEIVLQWEKAKTAGEVKKGNKSKDTWAENIVKDPQFIKLEISPENLIKNHLKF